MSEYIGSRISLFSKSDIRYIGTLHEIDSASSTVALEHVRSYGTEGRCAKPEDEVPASDTVYEYIVFKGSDVKDLTILDPLTENDPPPQVPNDPAILGSGSRPPPAQAQTQEPSRSQGERQPPPPQFMQHPMPYYYPPFMGQRLDGQNMPPPPPNGGFPSMAFGPPPNWYPPPGQGFPNRPPPYPGQPMPFAPPTAIQPQPQTQAPPRPPSIANGPIREQKSTPVSQSQINPPGPPQSAVPTPPKSMTPAAQAPTPPVESKPDTAAALAPPAAAIPKAAPTSGPPSSTTRPGQIVPAVPAVPVRSNAGTKMPSSTVGVPQTIAADPPQSKKTQPSQAAANAALQSATQAATAAVAAAMAKLPPAPGSKQQQPSHGSVELLTRKVSEMRTSGNTRGPRHAGTDGHTAGTRGSRGRGGHPQPPTRKIEIPTTDYDFETANAKFNKQDLVKEAIASGSPLNSPGEQSTTNGTTEPIADSSTKTAESSVVPPATYNRAASFFDNLSSETKDRDDVNGPRPGGREWRGEEQKKNLETFGQGSVDTGYRRGRGRGRGYGYRGRGGRGGSRGVRGGHRSEPTGQTVVGAVVMAST